MRPIKSNSSDGERTIDSRRLCGVVSALVWGGIVLLCIANRSRLTLDGVLDLAPASPWAAAVVILLLFALKSLSFFMYCGILYAVSGILLPPAAAIALNIVGTAIMVSLPYLLGRLQGRRAVERLWRRFPRLAAFRERHNGGDFALTLSLRLVGLLPCDAVSLFCGADGVRYRWYLPACIIGFLPEAVTFPLLGGSIFEPATPRTWVLLALNLALMSGGALWVGFGRRRRRAEKL